MKILCTAVTLLMGASLATAAGAEGLMAGPDGVRQARVSYADLDLSTPAGLQTMNGRIDQAATRVCGPQPAPYQLQSIAEFRACKATATNAAGIEVAKAAVQKRESQRVLAAVR